jgi:hypothetical protein
MVLYMNLFDFGDLVAQKTKSLRLWWPPLLAHDVFHIVCLMKASVYFARFLSFIFLTNRGIVLISILENPRQVDRVRRNPLTVHSDD